MCGLQLDLQADLDDVQGSDNTAGEATSKGTGSRLHSGADVAAVGFRRRAPAAAQHRPTLVERPVGCEARTGVSV